jgi:hypothetical protein
MKEITLIMKNGGTIKAPLATVDVSSDEIRFNFTDNTEYVVMNPHPGILSKIRSDAFNLEVLVKGNVEINLKNGSILFKTESPLSKALEQHKLKKEHDRLAERSMTVARTIHKSATPAVKSKADEMIDAVKKRGRPASVKTDSE